MQLHEKCIISVVAGDILQSKSDLFSESSDTSYNKLADQEKEKAYAVRKERGKKDKVSFKYAR